MDSGFPWWILLVVVFFGIFVYLMLMLFVPEWVGITGKTALENEKSHREGSIVEEPTPKGRMRTMPGSQPAPPALQTGSDPVPPPTTPHVTPQLTPTTSTPPTLTLVKKSNPTDTKE